MCLWISIPVTGRTVEKRRDKAVWLRVLTRTSGITSPCTGQLIYSSWLLTSPTSAAAASFHPTCYRRVVVILSANTSPLVVAAWLCDGEDCEGKFRLRRREASATSCCISSISKHRPPSVLLPLIRRHSRASTNRTWAFRELPSQRPFSFHLHCLYLIRIYLQAQIFIGTLFVFWTCTQTQKFIFLKN